jgi:triosephosphate isomerase
MRKRLIAGNWKLNGDWALCQQFVTAFEAALDTGQGQADVVVCPSAVYLARFAELIQAKSSILQLGGQDVSTEAAGAYTGSFWYCRSLRAQTAL